MALLIVGLGFKVAAVPFHFWSPDVYDGAPTPFTGYMASRRQGGRVRRPVPRAARGLRLPRQANWRPAIWLIAVLTLLVGSVLAIVQRDLKRMLAYSSISQAGYVLIGLQAGTARGHRRRALLPVHLHVHHRRDLRGGRRSSRVTGESPQRPRSHPGPRPSAPRLGAVAMLLMLLAQAGVPFTSGFLAKFYVIAAAVDKGQYALAVIGMLAAAIAAFFYLRVGLLMYSTPEVDPETEPSDGATLAGLAPIPGFDAPALSAGPGAAAADGPVAVGLEAPPQAPIKIPFPVGVTLVVCAAFTIFAGVSSPVLDFAKQATTLF